MLQGHEQDDDDDDDDDGGGGDGLECIIQRGHVVYMYTNNIHILGMLMICNYLHNTQ